MHILKSMRRGMLVRQRQVHQFFPMTIASPQKGLKHRVENSRHP